MGWVSNTTKEENCSQHAVNSYEFFFACFCLYVSCHFSVFKNFFIEVCFNFVEAWIMSLSFWLLVWQMLISCLTVALESIGVTYCFPSFVLTIFSFCYLVYLFLLRNKICFLK